MAWERRDDRLSVLNIVCSISTTVICLRSSCAHCWLKIAGKEICYRRTSHVIPRLNHTLPTRTLLFLSSAPLKSFYDAIVTDPPYNIKVKVITNTDGPSRERGNLTMLLRGSEETPTRTEAVCSAFSGARPDSTIGIHEMQRKEVEVRGGGSCADDKGLEWKAGDGARAEACANDLVGQVIWSLLSLARYSLKPGGRLCFFLPLRGAEARLVRLPIAVLERLSKGDHDARGARGKRLSVVYATKQRMKSPNMCRWLVVLEKERQ